ncbi:unnamed protein product, partial [Protopolystoma xenopodis]
LDEVRIRLDELDSSTDKATKASSTAASDAIKALSKADELTSRTLALSSSLDEAFYTIRSQENSIRLLQETLNSVQLDVSSELSNIESISKRITSFETLLLASENNLSNLQAKHFLLSNSMSKHEGDFSSLQSMLEKIENVS